MLQDALLLTVALVDAVSKVKSKSDDLALKASLCCDAPHIVITSGRGILSYQP